ncbi:alpha/beta hydrolase [Roseivirga sp.]|uniref:alpha/beta hydrolase n=1 Tax=Roseivirga sp. TaxID=1964215 RepID=UPI002B26F8AA|nr:alpha/beta hydrolase [Roseivirga sp.]
MEHKISFEYSARFHTLGQASEDIEQLWFVCHGHGQLAKYFIRKFEVLNDGKTFVVAPEGLSRYYLEGFTGRVGATWMTKEDRLSDIENYLTYLDRVFNTVKSQLKSNVQVNLLGFSQGAATISRFATQTEVQFDKLILWAGIFPPDLPPLESTERLNDKKVYWVYGTEDQYLSAGVMEEQEALANRLKIKPTVKSFKGEHELSNEVLLEIADEST